MRIPNLEICGDHSWYLEPTRRVEEILKASPPSTGNLRDSMYREWWRGQHVDVWA